MRHWLVVAVLAWLLASLVGQALDRADAARRRWGRTTVVWVADRPLRAGEELTGALRSHRWPAALVPAAAVEHVPPDARAAGAIDDGAALTAAMIAPEQDDRRTVAVPLPATGLPVQEGDRVDVWATGDPATTPDGEAPTRRVATGARVASTRDGTAVLEVRQAQVPGLAEAAATATITLVGLG